MPILKLKFLFPSFPFLFLETILSPGLTQLVDRLHLQIFTLSVYLDHGMLHIIWKLWQTSPQPIQMVPKLFRRILSIKYLRCKASPAPAPLNWVGQSVGGCCTLGFSHRCRWTYCAAVKHLSHACVLPFSGKNWNIFVLSEQEDSHQSQKLVTRPLSEVQSSSIHLLKRSKDDASAVQMWDGIKENPVKGKETSASEMKLVVFLIFRFIQILGTQLSNFGGCTIYTVNLWH